MGHQRRSLGDEAAAEALDAGFPAQANVGAALDAVVYLRQIFTAGEIGSGGGEAVGAQEDDGQAGGGEAGGAMAVDVLEQSEAAYDGRGENGVGAAFVVEADIAADHRDFEVFAGAGYAADAFLQLVIDFGAFRVAEVEAVGQSQGFGAHARQVAGYFGHHQLAAAVGVQVAPAPVAVDGQGDALLRAFDAKHGGVAGAGGDYGVGLHLVVVLPIDGLAAGDVGGGQEAQQDGAGFGGRRQTYGGELHQASPQGFGGGLTAPAVAGGVGQGGDRGGGDDAVAVGDARGGFRSDGADDVAGYVPALEHSAEVGSVFGGGGQQHPFLGFGEHYFVAGHAGFPALHAADVQVNAASAAGGGFHGGAGEAGGAQVLQGVDFAGGQGFQAGFDEGFLQEGVAHLHGGAAFLVVAVIVRKGAGSQAGSAVDAVPAGAGAGEEQQVARRVGGGAGEVVDFGDAHAHSVDQRVAGVGFVKADFAGHVGDADAVAVPGDAVHDAAQQPAVVGVVRGAEAEGVEQGDGAGAHSEDVADDAAHAGGGALQGFYGGGVVVGFHLEHDRQAVADVDGAGVFRAGPGQDAGGAGRQHSQ